MLWFTAQTKESPAITISMNFKEIESLYNFAKASSAKHIFWISSTETGIGCHIEVSDSNKVKQDISDYDSW